MLLALKCRKAHFRSSPYGGPWPEIAKRVRRRDGYTCRRCHRRGYVVHHRRVYVSAALRKPWPIFIVCQLGWNLVTLCHDCHEEVHRRDMDGDGRVGRQRPLRRR